MPSKPTVQRRERAFWDTSALAPLCFQQPASASARMFLRRFAAVAWWGTPVEITSAIARLTREGVLTIADAVRALRALDALQDSWFEVVPSDPVREHARQLLRIYPIRGADALQLAAAFVWSNGLPGGRVLVCGDARLANAAESLGFDVRRTG